MISDDEWMNKWDKLEWKWFSDEWMKENEWKKMNGRMNERMNERMRERMNVKMNETINEWINEWKNEWKK